MTGEYDLKCRECGRQSTVWLYLEETLPACTECGGEQKRTTWTQSAGLAEWAKAHNEKGNWKQKQWMAQPEVKKAYIEGKYERASN